MPDFTYSEAGQALVSSHDYLFILDDVWVTLSFPDGVTLSEKCAAIYHKWGQQGVDTFIDRCYSDVVEYGTCVPCESDTPFEKSDPETCLVCGSRQRDDHYRWEN